MLNTPAPFPEVGSWALVDREGEIVAARVTTLGTNRKIASISFPDRPTASGATIVPLDRLLDATPLMEAERREMAELARHLEGLRHPDRSTKLDRHDALLRRDFHSRQLVALLGKLNSTSLATGATREAHRIFSAALPPVDGKAAA